MLEQLYQGLYNDGHFTGSFEDFQGKMQDSEYRKRLHTGIVQDGDFTGNLETFENKFMGKIKEKTNEAYDWTGDALSYDLDEDGTRLYYNNTIGEKEREVSYDYDRSKGVRFQNNSYGKYLDSFAYNVLAPFVKTTKESIESGQEGEYTDEMLDIIERGSTSDMTIEEATKTIEIMQRQAEKAPSKEILKWSKTMEEESNPVYGFFKATVENPVAAYEAIISSVAGQVKALKSGELTTAAIAAGGVSSQLGGPIPQLRAAAFVRGFMSTMGGGVETASKFGELLKEEFADEENPNGRIPTEQELIDFVKNEEKFNKFRNKALLKGATIAAVDNFGGSVVTSSVAKTAKTGRKVTAATKGLVGESVVGGGGEALSSIVIGEEINATDVGLEILGQGGQATVDIGSALITPGSFKVNGEKASLKQVNKILETATAEELANIDIEIKNNNALENEVKNKQSDAILETQVDAKIDDESDRKKMVDLEKQRAKAEADIKKKGIQTVPGAKETLESIEMQMNEIVGKYTAIDGRTKDVRARKKTAEQVRENIADKNFETNLEFAKKHSALYGLEVDDTLTQDQIKKQYGQEASKSDGFIKGDKIIINKAVAKNTGAVNVGNHELLHGVLRKAVKEGKINKNLINDFKEKVGQNNWSKIEQRIKDAGYTEKYMKDTPEEYLTLFSDAIANNDIKFDENIFTKVGDLIKPVLRAFGFKKIDFETADGVYDFLKEYNRSIHKGALSSAIIEATEGKVDIEGIKMSRSKLIDTINDLQQGTTTKADFQKPETFNKVFEAVQSGGAINNYIRSLQMSPEKTQETIDAVTDRLINFDPAAKRKDGTVIGPKGLGEFIMANVGFGKLVAAKKLAVKAEKTKRTITIDTKEAIELEDTTTPATEIEDKTKPRNLKDFDVELQDGLVNEEIVEKVEALLERNPDDIEIQMEKLILNDIRKKLNDVIPKIAKDKKTGKRGPTPEYETWIRGQYEEVVQSLGMETIRKAYRPWFAKKKIRTEKYKGISPKTGKVTNYVKDVFENTTNKREYIRWFLESNERNLTERRTALIRRIARRKAKIATDNYIEVNSKNLGNVVEAKLRKASRAIEDTQVERKSFDAVKFSITSLKQEFGAIGRQTKKVGTKWVGYINPYTGLPQTFVDLGRVWEQAFANHFMKMKIKGFEVVSKIASEEDGMADFVFKFNDKIENHELKASITAFMGSVSMSNFGFKNGKITLATDVHNNLLEDVDMAEFKKGYKARIDYLNKRIKELNKTRPADKQYDLLTYDITSGKPQYAPNEIFNEKDFGTKMFYQLKSDERVIQNHYGGKDVHSLSFVSKNGNMSVRLSGESILNLPMLSANADINFTFRNPGSKMINGDKMRAVSLGIQFKISKLKNDPNTTPDITIKDQFEKALGVNFSKSIKGKKLNNAIKMSRSIGDSKGITVLDFDDTLATTKSLVKFTTPDGKIGTLNAEEYASTYQDLLDQGYTFDFSDFNKVVKGKLAPLFNKAIKLQGKFGPENMFVLTARPPASQKAIFDFLKANGLNIPLKNITGLGNSTSEAKALWIADKVGEGYNDFYFADDALQNVQAVKNMLDQFDVKSKVQQAKVKFSKSINENFNDILEEVTGIDTKKRFSDIKARKRGASKGKFRFFIPPSHEDFVGLLYNFMGKGRRGDQHRNFFEQALVRPLNRAYREIDTAKQAIANDYKELNKQFPKVKSKLRKKTSDGDFTFEDAMRVYLWNKHGYDIPGLTPTDQNNLSELIMNDAELQAYAETLNVISKQDKYVDPGNGWEAGNIKTDLIDATGRVGRAEYFAEFNENADILFSSENLNKIEAGYGKDFRSALEDMLHRIKTGVNRPKGQSGTINSLMNYLNGSVGTVMFFNVRSAILQQMSIVNYINFADNNLFAAAKAFANQKQYWKDFAFIFNSDMLKQRRGGIGTDINGADLAQAVQGSKQPTKIVISKLLKLGFLPTQIGDNIAIATGGATFYRNRINKYTKDGLSKKEAEAKAFTDFQDLTQSTQQSSRPDMTSKQQASWIGKLVLNFQNITSQYNRIIKKAALDIGKGRISPPYTTKAQSNLGNLSKILYYGGIQNIIFYSLQTALFAVMFDDDQDEDQILKKSERVINGSIDSILRGAGIYGAVASTLKNMIIKFKEQREKGYNKDESAVPMELLNFSPVVGIKIRQLVNAEKTLNYNENIISEMETFEADNPQWSAVTNYTQALTNFPANRLYQKSINMRNALDKDYTNFQRVMFFSGYTTWSLGLGDNERIIEAKEKAKINKKNKKKSKKRKDSRERVVREKIKR